jgi:sulfite exporter TauE/SafE
MVHIDRVLMLAFGIGFVLGLFLAGVGAWHLWQRIRKRHDRDYTK